MDVSSVSTLDYINLTGNYLALLTGSKDNTQELLDRGYTEAQIKSAQANKYVPEVKINGLKFTAPLTNFRYPIMGYVLYLHQNYEKGLLPYPGSVSEQPGQIMDILALLQSIKSEYALSLEKNNNDRMSTKNGRHNKNSPRTR
jgi:hypothetical protein